MMRDVGLWSRELRGRLIVVEPLGPLIDIEAMHVPLWHWWATRIGADPEEVVAAARGEPTARTLARFASDRDIDASAAQRDLEARRVTLTRLVRRARGALALLRDVPPRRLALWTWADETELDLLARRARLTLPAHRLTGLGTQPGDDAVAIEFLRSLGVDDPADVVALEAGGSGARRSRRIGARPVLVGPGEELAELGPRAATMTAVAVVPTADGVAVTVRREHRLR
jgi:hypothetical protein